MQKKGIDISHHQGDIDFDKLKGNIDFAMVRTSYGSFYEDKKYKRNRKSKNSVRIISLFLCNKCRVCKKGGYRFYKHNKKI